VRPGPELEEIALAPPAPTRGVPPTARRRYDRNVLGLLMLVVVGVVWVRRRWVVRREDAQRADWAKAEAEAMVREEEIIADLEARFHQ
jgi:hypothetical protein